MARIVIVNNPAAWRNRRFPATAARLARTLGPDGEVVDAASPEDLTRISARLAAEPADLLAVNGGDGTAHRVIGALVAARALPPVALLRGGAMNVLASSHGMRAAPVRAMRAVVERIRRGLPLETVERDLLRVEADGAGPVHGLVFGTGCVVAFLEDLASRGGAAPVRAALLLARAAASALAGGRFARALSRREGIRILADGEEWERPAYLAVLAGSVPQVGFGFEPLSRCDEQPGFFHAVGITASLPRLALSLPAVWRGRPWRRRVAADAVARELVLEPEAPLRFSVDGEVYGPADRLRVSVGPALQLLRGLGEPPRPR